MPVVEYIVNYDYIANVLCINKEDTTMKCNGKCQLGKEMAKEVQDTNPKETSKKKVEIFPQLFFRDIIQVDQEDVKVVKTKPNTPYVNRFFDNPSPQVLIQPPIV